MNDITSNKSNRSDIDVCSKVYSTVCKTYNHCCVLKMLDSLNKSRDLKTIAKTHGISVGTLNYVDKLNSMIGGAKMKYIVDQMCGCGGSNENYKIGGCGSNQDYKNNNNIGGCGCGSNTYDPYDGIGGNGDKTSKISSLFNSDNIREGISVMKEAVNSAKELTKVVQTIKGTDYVEAIEKLNDRIVEKDARIRDLEKQIENEKSINRTNSHEIAKIKEQNRKLAEVISRNVERAKTK